VKKSALAQFGFLPKGVGVFPLERVNYVVDVIATKYGRSA
jgi:hypothetical protein